MKYIFGKNEEIVHKLDINDKIKEVKLMETE